ncbi:MAG: hypothetical protein ABW328_21600 [Ilumatobacteraceae bacterium]
MMYVNSMLAETMVKDRQRDLQRVNGHGRPRHDARRSVDRRRERPFTRR